MTISRKLKAFYPFPQALTTIGRGIEREGLRIDSDGNLSEQPHPTSLGSALSNQWITTDFSEQMLEFITPVSFDAEQSLYQLNDIHNFTYKHLDGEAIWPFSMPCFVDDENSITLAQYGSSNTGKLKTLYRKGLKNRYGAMMQIISGVHFNFSFSNDFWQQLFGDQSAEERQAVISKAYFGLIRNYYRFGWLIPYLFGASPAICSSFIKKQTDIDFSKVSNSTFYLPDATSLRLSDLGYTSDAQRGLRMNLNSLDDYIQSVKEAIAKPSANFAEIGVKTDAGYQQINSNILQIEAELYAPIRPKRVVQGDETPSQALERGGVQYVEVRSLDINPFSPVGIAKEQIDFLDVFLTWCVLLDSNPMFDGDLECWKDNWRKIVMYGREPNLKLKTGCDGSKMTQVEWGKQIFAELAEVAELMDSGLETPRYLATCQRLSTWLDEPELTYSARILKQTIDNKSISKTGKELAKQYQDFFANQSYHFFSQQDFEQEAKASFVRQQQIEAKDTLSFDDYLAQRQQLRLA